MTVSKVFINIILDIVMAQKQWWELRDEKTTGRRVLVLTTLINGIVVRDEDLRDEDAMHENQMEF